MPTARQHAVLEAIAREEPVDPDPAPASEAEEARIREVGAAFARQHELHKAEMKQKEDILLFLMTFRLVSWQLAALGARDSPRANTAF